MAFILTNSLVAGLGTDRRANRLQRIAPDPGFRDRDSHDA